MQQVRKRITIEELREGAGSLEFVSDWFTIDQARIDAFAELTGDKQFIHVDPKRAAETPFGGTIAHGFLTASMLSAMAIDCVPLAEGVAIAINYGFDRLRFIAPVRSGARIRGHFKLVEFGERKPGELASRYAVTVEIEGSEKPALAAEWLSVLVLENPAAKEEAK
jgi:acyl dehydratase